MELETVSELARQKFYLHLSLCHVPVSPLCQRDKSSWLSCLAMSVGRGGARPPWQQHRCLQSCCPLCYSAAVLWQQHKCCSRKDGVLALPYLLGRTRSSLCGLSVYKGLSWEKGKKNIVDHEGEEWEGILTESKICFIKSKMKTSACMFSGAKCKSGSE